MCHAGVRPGIALGRQSEADLLWIREEFLSSRADFGKIVVHGHTPAESPQVRPNRRRHRRLYDGTADLRCSGPRTPAIPVHQ
jgi:hypothetical protein